MWILPVTQFCLLLTIKVASGTDCCLTRSSERIYCAEDEYCCQRDGWPDGSNLYCCSSYWDRANSIYRDSCNSYNAFPVWAIILIVIGLFFAIVTAIAVYCCVRKSRGFHGAINSTSPLGVISTGASGTTYPGSPPPYPCTTSIPDTHPYDKPPPYSTVMAVDSNTR